MHFLGGRLQQIGFFYFLFFKIFRGNDSSKWPVVCFSVECFLLGW